MSNILEEIEARFAAAGCTGALHVQSLGSGAEVALHADAPMVAASAIKIVVALEFFCQAYEGRIDPHTSVDIDPAETTPGPTGLSNFEDRATVSLRDLAELMMTISDNAATDILIGRLGLDHLNARAAACGCMSTRIISNIATMLDSVGADMGFGSYRALLEAQSGRLGQAARLKSIDPAAMEACRALDPKRATCTTARDMTRFLNAVWRDHADPKACLSLRNLMERQVSRRMEPAVLPGGVLAAKSGGLFRRIRNEIGVISAPDGPAFAFAIFTRAKHPDLSAPVINNAMADIVGLAIARLQAT
ncbi:MAG TPA: serine hydrolase [Alphaproteobacteria bacterium]|nr:serine hydrolase [Alphaproteobacteria bacterium]